MYSILNEVINDILENGHLTNKDIQNLQVVKNEDGDVIITYKNPANNKDVKEARAYLDSLEDDILSDASDLFRAEDRELFCVIAEQLKNPSNPEKLKEAMTKFKGYVNKVVRDRVSDYEAEITRLYDKYLLNKSVD